jgi:outer membrane protein TolC
MRLGLGTSFRLFSGLAAILLAGCAGTTTALDTAEHSQMLIADRDAGGQGLSEQGQIIKLSLEEAIARGYERNLDARVAALEALSQQDNVTLAQLRALPNMEASAGYVQRSNSGASSSRSVLTGKESLEPSQSTDEHRRIASLEANWNLLDAALALADASKARDETKIAGERYAKVIQNVERDVYTAYWRAQAYQEARSKAQALLDQSARQIDNFDTAANQKLLSSGQAAEKMALLSEKQRVLRDMNDRLSLAEIELKGMLSIPLDATLVLTTSRKDITGDVKRLLGENVTVQEWSALKSRPEMREEILKKNVSIKDTRREIFQSFPGLSIVASRQYDSNSFLAEPNWGNLSATIAQSITGLITLPDRYQAAKNKEAVADARRQALNSAILAQVHIARQRLQSSSEANIASQMAQRAASRKSHALAGQKSQGLSSGTDVTVAQLDAAIESVRAAQTYADMQDAYAAMYATLGHPIVDSKLRVASNGGRL